MLMLSKVEQDKFKSVVGHFDLEGVADWVFENNISRNLPYHNWYHAMLMVLDCYEGAKYESLGDVETGNLLMAALFHDFNHSGGHAADDENIRRALTGLRTARDLGLVSEESFGEVYALIEVTEFPYTRVDLYTSGMRIIRDADFNSLMHANWFEHMVCGLHAELSVKMEPELKYFPEMFDAFYSKHIPVSMWGLAQHGQYCAVLSKRTAVLRKIRDVALSRYGECTLPVMVELYGQLEAGTLRE